MSRFWLFFGVLRGLGRSRRLTGRASTYPGTCKSPPSRVMANNPPGEGNHFFEYGISLYKNILIIVDEGPGISRQTLARSIKTKGSTDAAVGKQFAVIVLRLCWCPLFVCLGNYFQTALIRGLHPSLTILLLPDVWPCNVVLISHGFIRISWVCQRFPWVALVFLRFP